MSDIFQSAILQTLEYSDQFNYPLNSQEIKHWLIKKLAQAKTVNSSLKQLIQDRRIGLSNGFYFLPKRKLTVAGRLENEKYSIPKWNYVHKIANKLIAIPTIQSIFVTGSLSMNNARKNDDIDLMIITTPNSLWLTRLLVVILLKSSNLRRSPGLPEHSSTRVANKICDNLYLDSYNLKIKQSHNKYHNLYLAHEILQAKPIYEREDIHRQFLRANSWVQRYLPNAYNSQLSDLKPHKNSKSQIQNPISRFMFSILNLFLFTAQYIYMYPKKTSEQIGLNHAFFHPKQPLAHTPLDNKSTLTLQ